jgi:hypothetical protein
MRRSKKKLEEDNNSSPFSVCFEKTSEMLRNPLLLLLHPMDGTVLKMYSPEESLSL